VCSCDGVFFLWHKEPDKRGIRYFLKTVFGFHAPIIELSLLVVFLLIRFGIPFLLGDVRITGNWWQVAIFVYCFIGKTVLSSQKAQK